MVVRRRRGSRASRTTDISAIAANLIAFVAPQQILRSKDLDASLGDPGVAPAIVFGAAGVGLFAVIALSLGVLLRWASPANILLSVIAIGGQILGSALPGSAHVLSM